MRLILFGTCVHKTPHYYNQIFYNNINKTFCVYYKQNNNKTKQKNLKKFKKKKSYTGQKNMLNESLANRNNVPKAPPNFPGTVSTCHMGLFNKSTQSKKPSFKPLISYTFNSLIIHKK